MADLINRINVRVIEGGIKGDKGDTPIAEWSGTSLGFDGNAKVNLKGEQGITPYQVALNNGFVGTEVQWLEFIRGKNAYELAVLNGYVGTQPEWILSLKGDKGDTPIAEWTSTSLGFDGGAKVDLKGATGAQGSGVKITPWSAGAYLLNDQVNHLGKDWYSNAATLSTDIPGTSSKWVERLSGYTGFNDKVIKNKTIISSAGLLNSDVTVQNNAGSYLLNTTDNVSEITASGAGTGIILNGISVVGIEYYASFDVRLKSGDIDKVWSLGYPSYGEGVDFTPTDVWQKVVGRFVRTTYPQFPVLIGTSNNIASGVIQMKNFELSVVNSVDMVIDKELKISKGFIGLSQTFDLQTELNKYDDVFVPVGTHVISTFINIPSGKRIHGIRGKSIIQASADLGQIFQILNATDITLTDLVLKGTAANTVLTTTGIPVPVGGTIDDLNQAISLTNRTTKYGLGISGGERININNCEFSNFSGVAILNTLSGKQFEYGIKVTDCYFHDNYLGLWLYGEAEYSTYIGNTFSRNQIGLYLDSGNNLFSTNHFDKNRVGVVISSGLNNAHGSFGECTFNHNALYGLIINGVTLGESFVGCQFWYGHIYIFNSKGINFVGGQYGAINIYVDGANGGQNQIANGCFSSAYVLQNYNSSVSNVSLKNNFNMDGSVFGNN